MLTTDYLIIGAGAMGMIFADQMLTETDARLIVVDRRARWAQTGSIEAA